MKTCAPGADSLCFCCRIARRTQDFESFNIFALASTTPNPLHTVLTRVLATHGIFVKLSVESPTWNAFGKALEGAYLPNPVRRPRARGDRLVSLVTTLTIVRRRRLSRAAQFHNAMHAADVVQAVYSMLHAVHMLPKLTELEVFAALLAAAAHGASHCSSRQQQRPHCCWLCVSLLRRHVRRRCWAPRSHKPVPHIAR